MERNLPVLRVRLFGREEVTYNNRPILSDRSSMKKTIKLWLILLYHGEAGIARNQLLEKLYGREELLDTANTLRVNIYRLKKFLLKEGLPEYDYIVIENGMYYWKSPMVTEVDSTQFLEYIRQAEESADEDSRILLLKKACELAGNGAFLQNLSDEEWVIVESTKYANLYAAALEKVCVHLIEKKEYQEAIKIVEPMYEMCPLDEWQAVKIECYIGMNRYKDALKEYEETAELLSEELGIGPSGRMQQQLQRINNHETNRRPMIAEIKDNFQETESLGGAFYCSFTSFRDEFRLVRRIMERSGQSNYLMLISITDSKGYQMKNGKKLSELARELCAAISKCLRRSDSYTRYNEAQFLILLIGTNKENCRLIFERIVKEFSKEHKSWAHKLENHVSSVADVEL